MLDNKKEVERAEFHRTIWVTADEMRRSLFYNISLKNDVGF